MAIDRAAVLRQAEKLLRLGKLEQAIADYERVVEDQPGDITTANALGDLYVRAGRHDSAVEQFTRIAAALERDGFVSKAGAIYKKILKLDPTSEPTLLKSAEIAAAQGLLADARSYFNVVARQRRARHDERGAAEITIRLGALDPLDVNARVAGAHARVSVGERDAAVRDLKSLVAELTELERHDDARRVLGEVLTLDPTDPDARAQAARASLAAGDLDAALNYATSGESAADPALLLSLADTMMRGGRVDEGMAAIDRVLAQDEGRTLDVVLMGAAIAAERPDIGHQVVLRAADSAAARGDWLSAAGALHEFLHRVPKHVPTLTRLVEVAVDGGLDETLYDTQAELADAHLDAGQATEARFIAEDLAARQPADLQNLERLRRALRMLGEPDVDAVIAARVAGGGEDDAAPGLDPSPVVDSAPPREDIANRAPTIDLSIILADYAPPEDARKESRSAEVDLSVALDGIGKPPAPVPPPPAPAEAAPPPSDLEGVFAQLRDDDSRRPILESAEQDLRRGRTLFQCGQFDGCLEPLQSAARVPRLQFESASLLGRALRALQRPAEALGWTERAAEAPATTPEAGHQVLYELADALEQSGDTTRALAICLELQAESTSYADLTDRIGRLSRARARG